MARTGCKIIRSYLDKVTVNSGSSISNRRDREVNGDREETYEKLETGEKESGNRLPAILSSATEASVYLCSLSFSKVPLPLVILRFTPVTSPLV